MAKLIITREDLLKTKVVDPGWYEAVIKEVSESPAKTDSSQNWKVKCLITFGPFEGVPVERTFNEKAPTFATRYFEAFGAKIAPGEFDFAPTLNQKVKIHISNSMYNNRMKNDVDDFMPIGAKPVANVEKAVVK